MRGVGVLVVLMCWASIAWAQAEGLDVLVLDDRPVVAVLAPMTGDFEEVGQRIVRASQLAADTWDVARFEVFDTAESPIEAYDRAVEQGAVAIIGPVGELETRDVIEHSSPDGPVILTLAAIDQIERARPHVFRARTSVGDQSRAIASYYASLMPGQVVSVMAPEDAYGDEAVLAFVESFVEGGGRVDRVVRYELDEPDYTEPVQYVLGERAERLSVPSNTWRSPPRVREVWLGENDAPPPDAVFIPDYGVSVADLLPFLEFEGWITGRVDNTIGLLGVSNWAGEDLTRAGDLATGALVTIVFSPNDVRASTEAFLLEYEIRFAAAPTEFDAQAYDAISFLLRELVSMDEVSPDRLRARLPLAEPYTGSCGALSFTLDGTPLRELGLWEIDPDGEPFPVDVLMPPVP